MNNSTNLNPYSIAERYRGDEDYYVVFATSEEDAIQKYLNAEYSGKDPRITYPGVSIDIKEINPDEITHISSFSR